MSLNRILLGILRVPATGYDIKQQFDNVFSHFWAADLPQIYRTLNRLEREGLLTVASEESAKGPERRVYRATAEGKRALRKWVTTAPTLATERLGYLAQTFFLGSLDDDRRALEFMHELHDVLVAEHEILKGIATTWAASDPTYPECGDTDDFYAQLTLDLGLHKLDAKVTWARRCIARIESRLLEKTDERVA